MGAVAVLLPDDILRKQITPQQPRRSRRRSSSRNHPPSPPPPGPTLPSMPTSPLTGQIRILKRGEQLTSPFQTPTPPPTPIPTESKSKGGGRRKEGFRSDVMMMNGFYAGSGFMESSPPPSSLPMPGVIAKRRVDDDERVANELRKILQLD